MTKAKALILTIVVWFIVTGLYAYYYIVSILAPPEPYDAYARNWQFQFLAFSLVRLPYLLLGLFLAIIVVASLVPDKKRHSMV